jgi:hypothetical protein
MQARPITFGQRNYAQQPNNTLRQQQQTQQQQKLPAQLHLPSNNGMNGTYSLPQAKPLALPGSSKFATPASATQQQQQQPTTSYSVPPNPNIQNTALTGPSGPVQALTPAVAATPRPVAHDEQTNITSVEGMVPTLQ